MEELKQTNYEEYLQHRFDWLVLYDNCVTDDIIIERYSQLTPDECWSLCMERSKQTGRSFGNFDMYIDEYSVSKMFDDKDGVIWLNDSTN